MWSTFPLLTKTRKATIRCFVIMLDPGSWAMIALSFIGAQVAHKAANGAIQTHPKNNAWECGLLRMLRAHVVLVTRTDAALDCLRAESFDLILSDISRDGVDDGGVRALPKIKAVAPATPVVFYVGYMTGSVGPEGSAGITNDPEELLHLILDRLERLRV